jgi:hypothetical protein
MSNLIFFLHHHYITNSLPNVKHKFETKYNRDYIKGSSMTYSITIPEGNFGLFISGGFDSALMLHLYCIEAKKSGLNSLRCITIDRGSAAVDFGKSICEWAENLHEIEIDHLIVSIPVGLHHSRHVSYPAEQLFRFGFKTLISADTQNPPVTLLGTEPVRIPPDANYTGWHFPFAKIDKSETVKLAHQVGILEDISKLSHSCTETTGERCGSCWQCNERAWAFKEVGLIDPGTF